MKTSTGAHRYVVGLTFALQAWLLAGCSGTVSQDLRVRGDTSQLVGVSGVTAVLSPEAVQAQAENPQFNREELVSRLRNRLDAKQLAAPAATNRVEILLTDIRIRGAFSAIMFGFMAGDDHVDGKVRVLDPRGQPIRSFNVHASYAFGGIAGGQDSVRMNWIYDKFTDLAMAELEKIVQPANADLARQAPPTGVAALPAATAPMNSGPGATYAAPAALDDADAVPVSERGRAAYRSWLTQKTPRAFIISENGWFYSVWGTKPLDSSEPKDPTERGMKRCTDAGKPNCKVYAVDNEVVYVRASPVAAH